MKWVKERKDEDTCAKGEQAEKSFHKIILNAIEGLKQNPIQKPRKVSASCRAFRRPAGRGCCFLPRKAGGRKHYSVALPIGGHAETRP
jgi:hypothetical protein